ncbi:hypothetical protein AHF37_06263 [Paragonimus kellicotti]|nr:hypothetical protein AHF37_06263 [Paragonimus kellicotti]
MWRKTVNAFSKKSNCVFNLIASVSNIRGTAFYDSFIIARESPKNTEGNNINHNLLLHRLISDSHPAYKAVIFDKDGTLICFNTMWLPWAKHVARSISEALNVELHEQIFSILGVCAQNSEISPGLLAEGTTAQISEAITSLLISRKVPPGKAQELTSRYINEHTITPDHISPLHNLKELFTILRQHNIRIAVCTSDSRLGTLRSLAELDVLHLVDLTVCGDDIDGLPKPHPRNAYRIFEILNVEPEQAVMVGDTATDMLFAKNGRFGMAIGVLSGVGKRENLEEAWFPVEDGNNDNTAKPTAIPQSTKFHIVHSVADILPLVLPDSTIPVRLHCTRTKVHNDDMNISEHRLKEVEYKLVIFDKNGSLTNVHPRWSRWAEDICEKLVVQNVYL